MVRLLQVHFQAASSSSVIDDIHQSPAWHSKYGKGGEFENDPRALSLAFCTDGLNPFAHENVSYSMWPITVSILNLPSSIRMKFG